MMLFKLIAAGMITFSGVQLVYIYMISNKILKDNFYIGFLVFLFAIGLVGLIF